MRAAPGNQSLRARPPRKCRAPWLPEVSTFGHLPGRGAKWNHGVAMPADGLIYGIPSRRDPRPGVQGELLSWRDVALPREMCVLCATTTTRQNVSTSDCPKRCSSVCERLRGSGSVFVCGILSCGIQVRRPEYPRDRPRPAQHDDDRGLRPGKVQVAHCAARAGRAHLGDPLQPRPRPRREGGACGGRGQTTKHAQASESNCVFVRF